MASPSVEPVSAAGDCLAIIEAYSIAWNDCQSCCSYDSAAWEQLSPEVYDSIVSALRLRPPAPRRQRRQFSSGSCSRNELVQLSDPYYMARTNRQTLQRLLVALAKWNASLGYSPHFASLCAILTAVLKRERAAFRVATCVHEQLQLEQYYSARTTPPCSVGDFIAGPQDVLGGRVLNAEARQVWDETAQLWPAVTLAFERHGQQPAFLALTKAWLLSLMAAGFDPALHPLSSFLPLLDRVLRARETGRGPLLKIVACVFGRRCLDFRSADAEEFKRIVAQLQAHVHVDQPLLQLIDYRLNACRPTLLAGLMAMPAGSAAGWALGASLGVGSGLGMLSGAVLCGVVGAHATGGWLPSVLEELVAALEEQQLEEED